MLDDERESIEKKIEEPDAEERNPSGGVQNISDTTMAFQLDTSPLEFKYEKLIGFYESIYEGVQNFKKTPLSKSERESIKSARIRYFRCVEYQTAYNVLFPILEKEVEEMLEHESDDIAEVEKLEKIRQRFADLPEDRRQTLFLENLYGKQELKATREKTIKELIKIKFIPESYKMSH